MRVRATLKDGTIVITDPETLEAIEVNGKNVVDEIQSIEMVT